MVLSPYRHAKEVGLMDIVFWTEPGPAFSAVLAAWLVLYLGRPGFHKGIRAGARLVRHPLELTARFLRTGADDIRRRNRALLQAQARADAALKVDREWGRLDEVVRRDVQGFPALREALLRQIEQWESEFKRSGEIPELSPEWTKAVPAVARLKATDDPMAERIQAGFRELVEKAQAETLRHHRKIVSERHRALARSELMWQAVGRVLDRVDNRLVQVAESTVTIHEAVNRYQALSEANARFDRSLAGSALVRLFAAGFVLLAACGGALLNVHLMAGPLRWLGIGRDWVWAGQPAPFATGFIVIALEVVAGLVLFDALEVTHVFGFVAILPKRTRRAMAAAAGGVIATLAALQAILAFVRAGSMREVPVIGGVAVPGFPLWHGAAQALLALILPGIMVFVAIPLESFIYAARAIAGVAVETAVRVMAFAVRVVARLTAGVADTLSALYDILILPPLLLERALQYGAHVSAMKRRRASSNQ